MSLSIEKPVIYIHPPEWYRGVLWQAVTPSVLIVRDLMLDYERALRMADRYNELIMTVGKCMPGKTRHEVALFYIQQAESPDHIQGPAEAAITSTSRKFTDPSDTSYGVGMDHKP